MIILIFVNKNRGKINGIKQDRELLQCIVA